MNNPVKDRTPREGNNWWVLVMVLLVTLGIFWALGRSGGDQRDAGPMSSPTDTYIAPADQLDNTSRTNGIQRDDDAIIVDEEPIIRVENDLDPEIRIDNDLERDRDR